MIKWPNLSKFNARAVILPNGNHAIIFNEKPENAQSLIKHPTIDNCYELINAKFNGVILKSLFPEFNLKTDIEVIEPDSVKFKEMKQEELVQENSQVKINTKADTIKTEDTTNPKKIIEDVGVKIGGARKDFKSVYLNVSDLANMNEMEQFEHVTLQNIWPFTIRGGFEDGMSAGVIAWIIKARKQIEDFKTFAKFAKYELRYTLPENEKDKLTEVAKDYIGRLTKVREAFKSVTNKETLSEAIYLLSKDNVVCGNIRSPKGYIWSSTWVTEYNKKYEETGGYIGEPNGWDRKMYHLDSMSTEDALFEMLPKRKEKKEDIKEKEEEILLKKITERPHLNHLKMDFLDGIDHDPNELIDRFGFKGIEFGNWLPQDERQTVINYAVASFKALAEILGIEENQIALNGTLSLAFGARGTGGKKAAMAHYEPARKVINLTRLSGAGSLAHEYGHAVDNFLGGGFDYRTPGSALIEKMKRVKGEKAIQSSLKLTNEEACKHSLWAGGWVDSATYNKEKYISRTEAMDMVNEAILITLTKTKFCDIVTMLDLLKIRKEKELAVDNGEAKVNELERLFSMKKNATEKANATSWFLTLSQSSMEFEKILNQLFTEKGVNIKSFPAKKREQFSMNADDSFRNAYRNLSLIAREQETINSCTTDSDFYENSKEIDKTRSSPYWSTDIELFARAFEQFVFYEIKDKNLNCDFLVHGVESTDELSVYPSENERVLFKKEIGQFIDTFAEELESKKDISFKI